jgi:hypothetical protein
VPQFQIRYSYLGTYLIVLPAIGVSACTLCNFVTVPRLVEAMSGGAPKPKRGRQKKVKAADAA